MDDWFERQRHWQTRIAIFNLPFLLLDECTSNLDAELTSEVVSVMKKYQHSRPVLLVAHQVVSGMFDKVVNIN